MAMMNKAEAANENNIVVVKIGIINIRNLYINLILRLYRINIRVKKNSHFKDPRKL